MSLSHRITELIKSQFEGEASGHDWHHIERVYKMALIIWESEGGDKEVIEAASLLHDISDHKLNGGLLNHGGKVGRDILESLGCEENFIDKVVHVIDNVSYKGAKTNTYELSLEGKIVQDADRLDAIGAIGIARVFAYGGKKGQPIYDPNITPVLHSTFEEYANSKTTSINHFHEKLLLLTDRLNTATAKKIGIQRHNLMLNYLDAFEQEWNVKIK